MRSPGRTVLPGRTRRVITSEVEGGPERRGAAIVVDSTASTVPLSRTVRTKSRRLSGAVAWSWPLSAWLWEDGWRAYRKTAAPTRTTVVTTAIRRAGVELGLKQPPVIRRTPGPEGW